MNSPIKNKRNLAESTTKKAILVNTLLMFFQFLVGLLATSPALIADSIHTASDLAADFVVLLACRFSVAAPDFNHQYGHHRYETVATLLLGILLIFVSVAITWKACDTMLFKQVTTTPHISALIVAITVLLLKECLFRYMIKQAEKLQSTLLTANAWHARSDAASSLIVSIGIAGSMVGYPIFDPVAAIFVGVAIAYTGCRFSWNALQDLSDRALPVEEIDKITETLLSVEGVKAVHRVRTRKAGDWILVDAHICVDPKISVSEGHFIAENAQETLCSKGKILDTVIHVDPEHDLNFVYSNLPNQEILRANAIQMLTELKCEVSKIDIHYLFNTVAMDIVLLIRLENLIEKEYQENLIEILYGNTFIKLAKHLNVASIKVLLEPIISTQYKKRT